VLVPQPSSPPSEATGVACAIVAVTAPAVITAVAPRKSPRRCIAGVVVLAASLAPFMDTLSLRGHPAGGCSSTCSPTPSCQEPPGAVDQPDALCNCTTSALTSVPQ
jgi:hypothetical protein